MTQGADTQPVYRQTMSGRCSRDASRYCHTRSESGDIMEDGEIIGYEPLWESMMKCKKGVIWKDSVAHFVLNGVSEVAKLSDELESGEYKERAHKYFTIRYPKEREIMSISFRDRVYQRSLNDVAIYPIMSRGFIYDNCACQKGKGSDFARRRMKCHMERFYRKYGASGYALKIDIRKYYDSMRHDVVKAMFQKKLPPNIYRRAAKILDGFPGDVGFNPGSQIIQIAGISLLSDIDHYIKERLRVRHYMRYMDDMVLISDNHAQLREWLAIIKDKLAELGLEVHSKKTKIVPLRVGFMWLGYRYRLTGSGKVVMEADTKRLKSTRRKYYRLAQKMQRGEISREKVDQSYQCWRECASKGDGWRMLKNMDSYYAGLMREVVENAENQTAQCPACNARDNQPVRNGTKRHAGAG